MGKTGDGIRLNSSRKSFGWFRLDEKHPVSEGSRSSLCVSPREVRRTVAFVVAKDIWIFGN
jgi:hypothetical protein